MLDLTFSLVLTCTLLFSSFSLDLTMDSIPEEKD